jgi:signal transduction histidine kinase
MRDSEHPELERIRAELSEVRASRARIVDAADDVRRRFERDLHDGAQQRLASVVLALGLAGRALTGPASNEAAGLVAEARTELNRALAELRELARAVYPVLLTNAGLGPALISLADRCPVPVVISAVPGGRLADAVERTCYFVVFEALKNVATHSRASQAEVVVREQGGQVSVEVSDDGVGGADPRGPGLRGLADRVAAHGGRLRVTSERGGGTRVMADLPCA